MVAIVSVQSITVCPKPSLSVTLMGSGAPLRACVRMLMMNCSGGVAIGLP
jgi:hypothetical protein